VNACLLDIYTHLRARLISKYVSITDVNGENRFRLKHIGEKELESFKDMVLRQYEKVPKDVIMVPCEYCGTMIPDSSSYCSNCGGTGKRKSIPEALTDNTFR
jgi:hypothetical protein